MRSVLFAGLLAVLMAGGCSSSAPPTSVASDEFPALRDLSTDTIMMVGPDASMGNWAAVRKAAGSKVFAEKVAKFESATIPTSIPDGAALKEKTVKALQNFITVAKTTSDKESISGAWKQLHDTIGELNAAAEGRKPS